MTVVVSTTPNPNAIKFTVGAPVGGPVTVTAETVDDDVPAAGVVAVDGVTSMFLTADFITVTKEPSGDWASIVPAVTAILEREFPPADGHQTRDEH